MRVDADGRIHSLESELARLSRALEDVRTRLARLEEERGLTLARAPTPAANAGTAEVRPAAGGWDIAPNVSAAGRLLLVLGGAYLLRALTDAGLLPDAVGVAAGLLYAFFWLGMASRAGSAGHGLQAGFHAASALVVAYPLLWETTARRELLSPPWSAFLVVLVAVTGLSVGVRHRLRATAWLAVGAAGLVTLALMVGTRDLPSFALGSVAVAAATLALALPRPATLPYLPYLAALSADLSVGLYALGQLLDRTDGIAAAGLAAQIALVVVSVYFFATRVVVDRKKPSWLAWVQTASALAIGYAGALFTGASHTGDAIAAAGIVAGAALFGVAQRPSLALPFAGAAYLAGTGVALVFLALLRLVPPPALAFALAAVGLALALAARRKDDALLPIHGAFFLLAGAVASGLVAQSLYALAAPHDALGAPLHPGSIAVVVAAAVACFLVGQRGERARHLWVSRARVAALVELGLVVLGVGAAVVVTVSAALGPLEAGSLAVVRTAVLAGAAVALGVFGRSRYSDRPELTWLQYPILVLGALKLLVEDVPNAGADRLFLSLAFYGAALILVSRLARR